MIHTAIFGALKLHSFTRLTEASLSHKFFLRDFVFPLSDAINTHTRQEVFTGRIYPKISHINLPVLKIAEQH